MHKYTVIRQSRLTDFMDSHTVSARDYRAAILSLFQNKTFAESIPDPWVEVYSAAFVIMVQNQAWKYIVVYHGEYAGDI